MKIGIVAAMQEEFDSLLKLMPEYEEISYRVFRYYNGKLFGMDTVLLHCGIGRVNAAVGTVLLIEKYKPDYVINTGVGGGFLGGDLRIGDIVVSSEVRHHDVDATVFNYEFGQVPRMPAAYYPDEMLKKAACSLSPVDKDIRIHEGQILSGDIFVHRDDQIQQIRERFPSAMVAEMEGAAIAQTCYLLETPFLIIRSISDLVDADQSHEVYKHSLQKTADNSVSLVLKLLQKLKDKN